SIFPFIRKKFSKLANEYFFSSLYDTREVISQISEQLRSTIEVDKMYRFISQALINSFHVKALGVLIYNEKKGEYFVQYNNNDGDENFLRLPGNKNYRYEGMKISEPLCDGYLQKNLPIIVDDLKNKELEKYKKDIEYWQAMGIELLVPLIVKDRNLGIIALSAKESGDLYDNEDIYVLKVIGAQVAISLENALLYQETLNFNDKLKREVAKQTRELIEANEKLRQLDQAKSEFISIASHQLRTPLSIIKGYISMILEGNFGVLTPGEKDSLEKVYKSNERIIDLVENLLNVSRIESGRLQFTFEEKQLQDLVASVYDELSINAKEKKLKFEFIKSVAKLPLVNLDETKMRQVIMNLIDNSIKYTSSGKVVVSLKKQKDNILFCVSDSGVGIKSDDLPNLFKKFSRGSGSSLINANGTGLGLFVAKKMIEAHRGRIWAESAGKGVGSRFYFEVPYVKKARMVKK
ncbi:GAF domain-containing sensor histidine kinase, partial [Patescibacteria group bacterium]|nr:GAF domain-containing sensor histidine kinase [Patescibacteria group bacterium]